MNINKFEFVKWDNNIRVYVKTRDSKGYILPNIKDGWAEFDMNGNLVKSCTETSFSHFPHEYDNELSEFIKSLEPDPFEFENVYLRFNELPKNGKSVNWSSGKQENGVSVYPLKYNLINGCYEIAGNALEGAIITYAISGASIYFVTGQEVGKGSDGEPLLSNVKVLSKAKYDMNKNGYIKI